VNKNIVYCCRFIYVSLDVNVHALASTLTDRIVRYNMDGTGRTPVLQSVESVIAISLDDHG